MSPTPPFEALAGLDRLIHEPARLAVLTALQGWESADFLFLQNITGLSKGNLSSHLSKLEEGGLVAVTKEFVERSPDPAGPHVQGTRRHRRVLAADGQTAEGDEELEAAAVTSAQEPLLRPERDRPVGRL